jgi:hypothetical protein
MKNKKQYTFSEGGYLIRSDKGNIFLSDKEYNQIKKLNNSLKEFYEEHKKLVGLIIQRNKGIIQHVLKEKNLG